MLEKKLSLRRIEFVFTDGEIHDECYYDYNLIIIEDGAEISRQTHREVGKSAEAKDLVYQAKTYVQPEDEAEVITEEPII